MPPEVRAQSGGDADVVRRLRWSEVEQSITSFSELVPLDPSEQVPTAESASCFQGFIGHA